MVQPARISGETAAHEMMKLRIAGKAALAIEVTSGSARLVLPCPLGAGQPGSNPVAFRVAGVTRKSDNAPTFAETD